MTASTRRLSALALPLLVLAAAPAARAATFCVETRDQLEGALIAAGLNQESDEIRVRPGVYLAPQPNGFDYLPTGNAIHYSVTLSGGWSASCTRATHDARITVLFGNLNGPVLRFRTPEGTMRVRDLTLLGGFVGSGVRGAGLHIDHTSGFGPAVEIERVIFRDNQGYAALYVQTKGAMLLTGCLFHSNLIDGTGSGAANLISESVNDPRITNNTFAGNTTVGNSPIGGLLLDNSAAADPGANVTNNIFWGNDHFDFLVIGHAEPFQYNDLGNGSGSYTGANNTFVDPLFRDPAEDDYQLRFDSPMLDSGSNTAASLPDLDLLGVARPQNGTYDRGAYEYRPPIFFGDFETGDASAWSVVQP
jgi:hypothetical protein